MIKNNLGLKVFYGNFWKEEREAISEISTRITCAKIDVSVEEVDAELTVLHSASSASGFPRRSEGHQTFVENF